MKMKHEIGRKKVLTIMVLSISILFSLLTIQNEAVDKTNNTSSKNTQTSSNTKANNTSNTGKTNNTTNTNTTTTGKSSNANLSNLGIKPHDFSGFKAATTSYKVTVPQNTETIEVYAKAQEAKATVTGTGKKKLEIGENKIEVVVTAEDGTKKTYTINITRGTQKEGTTTTNAGETNVPNGNGLSELSINGSTLSPDFQTNVYQYTTEYVGKDTKLNIGTVPTSEDYIVEIMGNENLKEGRNIITIAVSQKGGESIATYQITVNKRLAEEQEEGAISSNIIGIVVAIVILVAIIGFFVLRKKGSKNIAKDFSGVSLYKKHAMDKEETHNITTIPRQETNNITTMPRPEINDTTTISRSETNDMTTIPRQETNDTTIIPRPETNDTTTMPKPETNDTTTMPRPETNDTTTIPRQEINDITAIPEQETYNSTMIPKEEIQNTTRMPEEQIHETTAMPKEEYKEGEVQEIEKTSREELKEKFLNNYSNYEEDYEDKSKDGKRRSKHRGKRFK